MTKIKIIRYTLYDPERKRQTGDYYEMQREAQDIKKETERVVGVGFDSMGRVLHCINVDYDKTKFKNLEIGNN